MGEIHFNEFGLTLNKKVFWILKIVLSTRSFKALVAATGYFLSKYKLKAFKNAFWNIFINMSLSETSLKNSIACYSSSQ